jgi:hypothetical protein
MEFAGLPSGFKLKESAGAVPGKWFGSSPLSNGTQR